MKVQYVVCVAALIIGSFAGCAPQENNEMWLQLNANLHRNVASSMAVSPTGERALTWVTLSKDVEQGQVYVQINEEEPVQINDGAATPVLDPETPPQIAFGANQTLFVSYAASQDTGDKWNSMAIRVVRSDDGGQTWSDPVSVAQEDLFGGYRNDHEMFVGPDEELYIAWLDSRFATDNEKSGIRIVLSRSVDGGRTWSGTMPIDKAPACECCRVALAMDKEGRLLAGWRKILPGGLRDIVVARSSDRGETWSEPVRVFADDWEMQYCPDAGPALQVDHEGGVHVAWWTGKEGAAGVKYAASRNGGQSFEAPVVMKTAALSRASHAQLALDENGMVAVTWDDGTLEMPRIALRVSHDGGRSFGDLRYISSETKAAAYPVAAFQENRLTLAWNTRGQDEHFTRLPESEKPTWIAYTEDATPQLVVRQLSLSR